VDGGERLGADSRGTEELGAPTHVFPEHRPRSGGRRKRGVAGLRGTERGRSRQCGGKTWGGGGGTLGCLDLHGNIQVMVQNHLVAPGGDADSCRGETVCLAPGRVPKKQPCVNHPFPGP
jgi:hypothetical protein